MTQHDSLTPDDIRALIHNGETDEVDLKPDGVSQAEIAEILMSMANAGGEYFLVIGLENQHDFSGVLNPDSTILKVKNAAQLIAPSLTHAIIIESAILNDKKLVIVRVPAHLPSVYHVNGRYLRRRGNNHYPIQAEELLRLMHQRGGGYYEDQPVPGTKLADIDPAKIGWYLARREGQRANSIPTDKEVGDFLETRGLIQAGYPTVAAQLIFGYEPQRFFPYHVIRAMRFADHTTARIVDRKDIGGTVPEMIEQTLAFVEKNIRHPSRFEGALRVDDDEYPMEAVREAIANACAHRDMSITNGQMRVFIFSDRILVDSPGELLPGVRIDRLTQISRLRNPRTAQLLYDTGYMERAGTGISRMIQAMQEHSLEPPIFEEVANSLQVTLRGPEFQRNSIETIPINSNEPALTAEVRASLNSRQIQFLAMLAERTQMSRRDYEAAFDVSERTANNDLVGLVRKNLISAVGSSVRTVYTLKK